MRAICASDWFGYQILLIPGVAQFYLDFAVLIQTHKLFVKFEGSALVELAYLLLNDRLHVQLPHEVHSEIVEIWNAAPHVLIIFQGDLDAVGIFWGEVVELNRVVLDVFLSACCWIDAVDQGTWKWAAIDFQEPKFHSEMFFLHCQCFLSVLFCELNHQFLPFLMEKP